jgi:V/A-type H+-transporting ATPase subunit I
MRVDVKKFLIFGPVVQKKEFFKKAQKLGAIEFIDHSGNKFDIIPEAVKKMSKAVRILRGVVLEKQYEEVDYDKAKKVTEQILLKQERIDALHEERRLVRQEMSRVAAFGDFNPKDIKFIEQKGKRVIQFFFAKMKTEIPDHPELIYVGTEHNLHYYVSINKERQSYENMVEMVVDNSYGELKQRKKEIDDELHQIDYELKELSTYKTLIKKAIVHEFNSYNLIMNHNFLDYHW